MNKKLFLICLFFFNITCVESYCTGNPICFAQKNKSSRSRRMSLKYLSTQKLLRSNFIPYIAEVDNQSINITYLQEFSSTTIEVFNESGECIYSTTVNPVPNGLLIINIDDWANGYYTIYFKNSKNDKILHGEFELQNP